MILILILMIFYFSLFSTNQCGCSGNFTKVINSTTGLHPLESFTPTGEKENLKKSTKNAGATWHVFCTVGAAACRAAFHRANKSRQNPPQPPRWRERVVLELLPSVGNVTEVSTLCTRPVSCYFSALAQQKRPVMCCVRFPHNHICSSSRRKTR